MNQRELFLKHVAQTSPSPLGIEVARASGTRLFDTAGKSYIDLIGGISVCNMGHCHPAVVEAVKKQAERYLHVLVYGEFIQSPQVQYAHLLAENLPPTLNSVYFTNSGAEATEGAMKLAKRATGRTQLIAFKNAYHGSTQGALSIMGDEYWRNAFRPLLPDVLHLDYNSFDALSFISGRTAAVIAETVQAESGIHAPSPEWMQALRQRCNDMGALLVLDEIQAGFGRTGTRWGFEQIGAHGEPPLKGDPPCVPDILLLGKALGGGMPLGAFIADRALTGLLAENPVLGHITTFGGHPVCCAAGMAAFGALLEEGWLSQVKAKEQLFRRLLTHPAIKAVRSYGLWMAVEFDSFDTNKKVIDAALAEGVLTDWFLFAPQCLRIAPPLIIEETDIEAACHTIVKAIDAVT